MRRKSPLSTGLSLQAAAKPVTIENEPCSSATSWLPVVSPNMPLLQSTRLKNQFWTAPNQITLLRLIFIPFVIISVFDGDWAWALGLLIAAALSDALDGLLARTLHQQTMLGQYLDPIADKLLLSSLFLVLSFVKKIPWKYTVLVFSRDVCLVATSIVLYATVGFRDFRPSIFGKINTACQIAAVFFVVLSQVLHTPWVMLLVKIFLYATFTFTTISGVHYVLITGHRLRKEQPKPAS
jgi:cardiolipin synthase